MMNVCWCILAATLLSNVGHSSEAVTVKGVKQSDTTKSPLPKVLLLSIASLRAGYLSNINLTTNINRMVENGTKVKYVENSGNVLGLVNHYSMTTGLYPESHGIISNTMFDPELNRVFSSKTREQPEWWVDVHPIWQEIEKQGLGMSALCRWPGVYGPMVSTLHCNAAAERKSLKDDIDQAIRWLKNDVKLVLLYSDDIKKAARKWGPHSPEAMNEVKIFDSTMKYLLDNTRGLNVNILLTSDSGVTDLYWDHVIDLDQCIEPKSYVLIQPQSTLLIYPKHGHTVQELYLNLTKCAHVKVYLKQDLPPWLHFSNHRRIPPIVAFVPLGAVVRSGKRPHRRIDEVLHGATEGLKGGSGYHPGYEVMRGVFLGYGPSFQSGLTFSAIKNVDIYGLLCHLLEVAPRPNNGSRDVVSSMFNDMTSYAAEVNTTDFPPQPITAKIIVHTDVRVLFWFLVVTTVLLTLFCCIGCLTTMWNNYKRGFRNRTKVKAPPGEKPLLTSDSSDEE